MPTKVCLVKAMAFLVVMYRCESWTSKESWVLKSWCFWTMVLEKTLESPLNGKEIQPVHPKGNQSWIFIGRLMLKLKLQYFGPPVVKNWLIWKDPDAGKDWRQEEKGMMRRGWDGWMASPTQWTWVWVNSRNLVMDRETWHAAVHGVSKSLTWLSDWTELNWNFFHTSYRSWEAHLVQFFTWDLISSSILEKKYWNAKVGIWGSSSERNYW